MKATLEEKARKLEECLLGYLTERKGLPPPEASEVLKDAWKRAARLIDCGGSQPLPADEALALGLLEAMDERPYREPPGA